MHRKLKQSGKISQEDAKDIEALLSLPGGLTLHEYVRSFFLLNAFCVICPQKLLLRERRVLSTARPGFRKV